MLFIRITEILLQIHVLCPFCKNLIIIVVYYVKSLNCTTQNLENTISHNNSKRYFGIFCTFRQTMRENIIYIMMCTRGSFSSLECSCSCFPAVHI